MEKKLEELKDLFVSLGLSELAYKDSDFEIAVKREGNGGKIIPLPAETHEEEFEKSDAFFRVESPIVGIFYSRPSPDEEPFVKPGDHVEKGNTLCVVEAMKMFNEIPSPVTGTVKRVAVGDGEVISPADVLMEIEEI